MPPRPAPDLDRRRVELVQAARLLGEAEGWDAVTIRRLAGEVGATPTVVYSAFENREALIDAVAVDGFTELTAELRSTPAVFAARARAYLDFQIAHQRTYEAMFLRLTRLPFATKHAPAPLRDAFAALREALPNASDTATEVVWATLHGLATLSSAGRLRTDDADARFRVALEIVDLGLARRTD